MRDPKLEELNEDLKIDALKGNIAKVIEQYKVSSTIAVYVLRDLLQEMEIKKQEYLQQSFKELQDKLSNETEAVEENKG